jgi:hypothetical protein
MTQYSLAYDSSGNSSLVATKEQTTSRISSGGDWKVSDYFAPRMDYGITETYKNTPEEQLETIQKVLVPQSGDNDSKDDKDYKKDLSPTFNWKDYTYNEYVKALGVEAADSWLSAYNLEKAASAVGWVPFVPVIGKVIAKGTKYYAEKKKEDIVKQYINSKYFIDNMANMAYEYNITEDYDSYNDLSWHPSYGKEYKPGTVFDADTDPADEGILEPPGHPNYNIHAGENNNTTTTQKHHGDVAHGPGGRFETANTGNGNQGNNNTGSDYSRPGASGHPTGHHW